VLAEYVLLGGGGSHTDAEREALKAAYGHACLRCGKHEPEIEITRDHIVPVVKSGSDDIANIQPLCRSCNGTKGAQTIDYRPQQGSGLREARVAYALI
jgi:5-methylcytosine-specific restriction endonuclease McrA